MLLQLTGHREVPQPGRICKFLLWAGVVVLKELICKFLLWAGVVVLKELILTVSIFGGHGGPERTD